MKPQGHPLSTGQLKFPVQIQNQNCTHFWDLVPNPVLSSTLAESGFFKGQREFLVVKKDVHRLLGTLSPVADPLNVQFFTLATLKSWSPKELPQRLVKNPES